MSMRGLPILCGLLLLSGCLYHVREQTDRTVCELTAHAFDVAPPSPPDTMPPARNGKDTVTPPGKQVEAPPPVLTDVQTTALMEADPAPEPKSNVEVKIPAQLPGAETPRVSFEGLTPKQRADLIAELYPPLPALPQPPTPNPGPNGHPYTLADFQQMAAANSPTLRQAASDVKAAEGNLRTARAYPNPTVGLMASPSNDGSTMAVWGPFFDQTIKNGGKLRLATAAAEKDLENAELALKRARSDLSTAVRNAYYALLVAQETMRVNRALAEFTDNMYRLQVGLLQPARIIAAYEPAALRAQAYMARLTYQQAIDAYWTAWKQLVAAVGLRQLPLSEVSGRVDRLIPYFDYDAVLAHVLENHTDVLSARNGIDKARFQLKLAQITPWAEDLEVNLAIQKEYALAPQQFTTNVTIGMPLPIWDQNKGPIIAAEAALVRATEEPHRMETVLTTNLAIAYNTYKANLQALEYYRRYILPDQVRAYRGVYERRQLDINAAFGDLVQAQQTLAADVTAYLGILGQLWTSAVSVADLLQTDDLFAFGQPQTLPPLPDLAQVLCWPCPHPCGVPPYGPCPCGEGTCASTTADLYPHFMLAPEPPSAAPGCPCPTAVPCHEGQPVMPPQGPSPVSTLPALPPVPAQRRLGSLED